MNRDGWEGVPANVRQAARTARVRYEVVRDTYDAFARSVATVLQGCLESDGIAFLSVTPRAKTTQSFERKAATLADDDPSRPKYDEPFEQITDKAAVRVITYFMSDVKRVSQIVKHNFEVLNEEDKGGEESEQVGYRSVHFLVRYPQNRVKLPDYQRYKELVAELQVRTVLQHAWAEIEHDIQYKASEAVPAKITRRFNELAGLVQVADREFQAIHNEHRAIERRARNDIKKGRLEEVELTADALRTLLDQRIGPDRHVSPYSYRWTVRVLKRLGFVNLAEVASCIEGYDIDEIDDLLYDYRQNQITRFQNVLLAGIGEPFINGVLKAYQQVGDDIWRVYSEWHDKLVKLSDAGIRIKYYEPPGYTPELYDVEES